MNARDPEHAVYRDRACRDALRAWQVFYVNRRGLRPAADFQAVHRAMLALRETMPDEPVDIGAALRASKHQGERGG